MLILAHLEQSHGGETRWKVRIKSNRLLKLSFSGLQTIRVKQEVAQIVLALSVGKGRHFHFAIVIDLVLEFGLDGGPRQTAPQIGVQFPFELRRHHLKGLKKLSSI